MKTYHEINKEFFDVRLHVGGSVEILDAVHVEFIGIISREYILDFYMDLQTLPEDCAMNDVLALILHYNMKSPQ